MAAHGVSLARRTRPSQPTRPANGQGTGRVGGGGRFLVPPAGVDPTKYRAALSACRPQISTGAGSNGTGRAASPGPSAGHVVVYKVTGDARKADVVYVNSGGANDAQASVPYQVTATLSSGVPFSVIAQGIDGSTIGCEVLVDGKAITNNVASAPALAECNGVVP